MYNSDTDTIITPETKCNNKKHYKAPCEDSQNIKTEESESLLKVKKKKYFDMSGKSSIRNDVTPIKKEKVSIEYLTQYISKQWGADELASSTPKPVNQKNHEGMNASSCKTIMSPLREIKNEKDSSSVLNGHDITSLTEHKKKKNKGLNLSMARQIGDEFLKNGHSVNNSSQNNSKISHKNNSCYVSDDSTNFRGLNDSDINLSHTKRKKKKKRHKDTETDEHGTTKKSSVNQNDEETDIRTLNGSKSPLKGKKNKYSDISGNDGATIKREEEAFIDYPSQHISKQSNSEVLINSTPEQVNLKKHKDLNANGCEAVVKKIKREKYFSPILNGRHDISSLIKRKKKKNKGLNLNMASLDRDQSFKNGDSFNHSERPITVHKKKYSTLPGESVSESGEPPVKRKKKDSIDHLTQDIFRQPSSEDFANSTPKKVKKKKKKESNLNDSDVTDAIMALLEEDKQEKYLNSSNGHGDHVLTKDNKKKDKVLDSSIISLNGSLSLKHEDSFNNSSQNIRESNKSARQSFTSFNIRDDSKCDESQFNLPHSKHKKKKKKHDDVETDETNSSKDTSLDHTDSKKGIETLNDGNIAGNNSQNSRESNETARQSFNISDGSNSDESQVNLPHSKHKKKKKKYNDVETDETDSSKDISLDHTDSKKGIETLNDGNIAGNKSVQKAGTSKYNETSTSKSSSGRSNGKYNDDFTSSDDFDDQNDDKFDKLELLKSTLKSLVINVDFPVPKLHRICNRASKPTPQQRGKISEESIPVKLGKFVKTEDEQIKANWQQFIQTYNFEDIPELFFSLDKKFIPTKEKRNFLFFLSQNLPERTPYSVFLRFKLLTMQAKKGRFTEEEDKYILRQMEETGCRRNYITEIAQHLQRPFNSVDKRIQTLKSIHARKIRWKKANMAAFVKYLLRVTGINKDCVEKLKNRHISSKKWVLLSKKLDNVPIRILKRAWLEKIHPMLFVPDDIYDLREVKLQLINMFYENHEIDWRSVNWSNYASHFEGLTYLRMYSLMKTLVMYKVPREKRNNLKKCIKKLRKITVNDLPVHVIYKVKYENGEIVQLAPNRRQRKEK